MSAYRFRALDAGSREHSGVLEADTARQARGRLRERGLLPVAVELVGAGGVARSWAMGRAVRTTDLVLLTAQWSTLLDAGLTVEQSLNALIDQTERPVLKQLLAGVRSEVAAGHSLQQALNAFPETFPRTYRALTGAGERSGQLAAVFERLARHLEAGFALRQRMLQALIYPVVLGVVAFAVIVGLMAYVVPQVVGVFVQSHQVLPLPTRVLLGISTLLRQFGVLGLLLVGAGAWLVARTLREDGPRRAWHQARLRLPLFGSLARLLDSTRFASTLAILVGSGVPLLQALEAARDVMANEFLRAGVDTALEAVRQGQTLHRALGAQRQLSPLLIHLVASGEATGRLEQVLQHAARQQQAELDNRVGVLLALLEPALILVMGAMVLFIVLAVLLPVIGMNQLVH